MMLALTTALMENIATSPAASSARKAPRCCCCSAAVRSAKAAAQAAAQKSMALGTEALRAATARRHTFHPRTDHPREAFIRSGGSALCTALHRATEGAKRMLCAEAAPHPLWSRIRMRSKSSTKTRETPPKGMRSETGSEAAKKGG